MSTVDNVQIAVEEQQKAKALDKSQKSDVNAKKKINKEKNKVAMLSYLEDLTLVLLHKSSKQVIKDEKKLSDSKVKAPSSKKKKPSFGNTQDAAPSAKQKKSSIFDFSGHGAKDPLLALVEAGVSIQAETNQIIKSLGTAGAQITEVTTKAAAAGNDWMSEFYKYGITASGNPGQYDTGSTTNNNYVIGYHDGSFYYFPWKSGNTWPNWDNGSGWTKTTLPSNYNAHQKSEMENNPIVDDGHWIGYKWSVTTRNGTGIPGATGAANSAKFNELVNIWQYVQQQVSQINNKFQTVAGLPPTMMSSLTQSVNTSYAGMSSTIQAMGTTTSLVRGWVGL